VRPYVAFSMLQPVTIAWSDVSRAAPTLNREKPARAFRRALLAPAIRAAADVGAVARAIRVICVPSSSAYSGIRSRQFDVRLGA
jgi:hypothetical protein